MNIRELPDTGTFDIINAVLGKLERGEKMISLAVGEPLYDTPQEVVEEAYRSMKEGNTHYAAPAGLLSFRKTAAAKVQDKNGIECSESNCMFMTEKMAIYSSFLAVSGGQRNEILLPDPGFFYTEPALLAGLTPVYYNTAGSSRKLSEEIVSNIGNRTAAAVVNDPNNPTGGVMDEADVRRIYESCSKEGCILISDEAYEDLVYGKRHISPGSFESRPSTVVSLFTLSKSYSMTGWRAGYAVAPPDLLKRMITFVEHTCTCFPPFIQKAAEFAIQNCDRHIARFRQEFSQKRDIVQKGLRDIREIHLPDIDGAFYAFPEYELDMSSAELSRRLLEERGVAVLPGSAFGKNGERHFRLSFSGNVEDIETGIRLVSEFFDDSTAVNRAKSERNA